MGYFIFFLFHFLIKIKFSQTHADQVENFLYDHTQSSFYPLILPTNPPTEAVQAKRT